MMSSGFSSCIAFLVSMAIVLPSATSFPTIRDMDFYNMAELEDSIQMAPGDQRTRSLPLTSPDTKRYPWELTRSSLLRRALEDDMQDMPVKRNYRLSRRGGNDRHTLNELIRRLLKLRGEPVPENRTNTFRFGSGRK